MPTFPSRLQGLPFWSQWEILSRELYVSAIHLRIESMLRDKNSTVRFVRVEAPIIQVEGDQNDQFRVTADSFGTEIALRTETTQGSYLAAEELLNGVYRAPLVVWQVGKVFRHGADVDSAKMVFYETNQMVFHVVYPFGSKLDYHDVASLATANAIRDSTGSPRQILYPAAPLPDHVRALTVIEVQGKESPIYHEVAAIRTRTDFPIKHYEVVEITIDLDRLVCLSA